MKESNLKFKIGVDIVEISRIEAAIGREVLLQKAFSKREREYFETCGSRAETLAGMYAAKEAIIKAAEQGICTVKLNEIEILHKSSGAPFVEFCGQAKILFSSVEVQISISHDGGFAVAVALMCSKNAIDDGDGNSFDMINGKIKATVTEIINELNDKIVK